MSPQAVPAPSTKSADVVEPAIPAKARLSVRFLFVDIKTVWALPPQDRPPGSGSIDTEPELELTRESGKPERVKAASCKPGVRPGYNICDEFKTCHEFTSGELKAWQSVMPSGTEAAVACSHSSKGPAHLFALRVTKDAIVVERSRTDPGENSSLPHPLCKSCWTVVLRSWSETARVELDEGREVLVNTATRMTRTVVPDV